MTSQRKSPSTQVQEGLQVSGRVNWKERTFRVRVRDSIIS